MRMTELQCTVCNGTLKLDEKDPNMAVYEYCKFRYVLEDEGSGNVRLTQAPAKINYVPVHTPGNKKTGGYRGKLWQQARLVAGGCIYD